MKTTSKFLLMAATLLFFNCTYSSTVTWIATSGTNWGTTSNWSGLSAGLSYPATTDDVIINSGTTVPRLNSNRTIGSLTINGGGVDLDEKTLTVTNTTTFNGGSLIANGGSGNTGRLLAKDVIIDYSGTVILSGTGNCILEITNSLTFVNGYFQTSSSDIIYLRDGASHSGASDASHITGPLRRYTNGNNSFIFPIGNGLEYAPIEVSGLSGGSTSRYFTAQYFGNAYSNTSSITTSGGTAIDHVCITEYWDIARSSSSLTASVTVCYENPRSGSINSTPDLVVAHWNNSTSLWESLGNGASTGNASSGSIKTAATVTNFSPFTLGSASTLNPLPMHLLSFKAYNENKVINVAWTNIGDRANDYFFVEKSVDQKTWTTIGTLTALRNSTEIEKYNLIDMEPVSGIQYYRLGLSDLKGEITYSKVVPLYYSKNISGIQIYPNPTSNNINVCLPVDADLTSDVDILNSLGQQVLVQKIIVGNIVNFNVAGLQRGVYYLRVIYQGTVITEKINIH